MSQDQLTIASVTGVDVEFQIAGPGSRSYAFIIDLHIRFFLAFAWGIVAFAIAAGGFSMDGIQNAGEWAVVAVVLPPLLIYFFYHPVAELVTRGRSPGKRMAGVRLISRDGDVPSVGALLIRNLFRIVDSLPGLYIIGLVCTLVTKQHVRIGDLAAGTLLVIDHDREGKSLAKMQSLGGNPNLDPKLADLIHELLERWRQLSEDRRRQLAVALLKRVHPQSDEQRLQELEIHALHAHLRRALSGEKQP